MHDIVISFKYPGFFLFIGLVGIYFLTKWYYNNKNIKKVEKVIFRFVKMTSLFMILTFFFEPKLELHQKQNINTQNIYLIDNSKSIGFLYSDLRDYSAKINEFCKKYFDRFQLYSFGDSLKQIKDKNFYFKFKDSFSDISMAKSVNFNLKEKNISSINLITDGQFNRGDYSFLFDQKVPINVFYTDTTLMQTQVDIRIENVVSALDDNDKKQNIINYDLIVGFDGHEVKQKKFTLNVFDEKGKRLKSITAKIPASGRVKKIKISILKNDNDLKNVKKIIFKIDSLNGEKNTLNNTKVVFQVSKKKKIEVLILNDKLSFDLVFLKKILRNYDCNISVENTLEISKKYDLIVLLSFPTPKSSLSNNEISFLKKTKSKIVFINENTDLKKMSLIFPEIEFINNKFVQGKLLDNKNLNSEFAYFYKNKLLSLENLPNISFCKSLKFRKNYSSLLDVNYNNQIYTAGFISKNKFEKTIIFNLDSFWRLIFEVKKFSLGKSDFEKFIINILDYFTSDIGLNNQITIKPIKETFYTGEKIKFNGKIFNREFKFVDSLNVKLIINDIGANISLLSNGKDYEGILDLNNSGIYNYKIEVLKKGKIYISKLGSFKIKDNDLEALVTTTNMDLLREITKNTNGFLMPIDSLDAIGNKMANEKREKSSVNFIDITKNIWYFIILLFFIFFEWTYRKYKHFL